MNKRILIVIGLVLVLAAVQSCSSKPENTLLTRYFNSLSMKDNATLSSIALEPLDLDVASWEIISVSPEKIEPATLADLNQKEMELKKQLEGHVGPTVDAKDALDVAKEDLDLARTAAAKATAKKRVEELQVKYDEEYKKHQELQKAYNDAKNAAAAEEEMTRFSLGVRELAGIRDLTGNVHTKDVVIRIKTKGGETKEYTLPMRMYQLKTQPVNVGRGRWVIIKFAPKA